MQPITKLVLFYVFIHTKSVVFQNMPNPHPTMYKYLLITYMYVHTYICKYYTYPLLQDYCVHIRIYIQYQTYPSSSRLLEVSRDTMAACSVSQELS